MRFPAASASRRDSKPLYKSRVFLRKSALSIRSVLVSYLPFAAEMRRFFESSASVMVKTLDGDSTAADA